MFFSQYLQPLTPLYHIRLRETLDMLRVPLLRSEGLLRKRFITSSCPSKFAGAEVRPTDVASLNQALGGRPRVPLHTSKDPWPHRRFGRIG